MQEVEDATILSMLNSDEEKAAFEDVLFSMRAKAMTAAAAGAYHTTMITDGTMAANAVTTGVIECGLDTTSKTFSRWISELPTAQRVTPRKYTENNAPSELISRRTNAQKTQCTKKTRSGCVAASC
jgi:hypothetical protein